MKGHLRESGRIFKRSKSVNWWIAYMHRGREIRESSGSTNPKDAERLLKHRLREIGADRLGARRFVGPEAERVRVGELLDALEADLRLRRIRSLTTTLSHMKHVWEAFGDRRAATVSAEMIDRFIETRLKAGAAPSTINHEVGLLRQGFKLGLERGRLSSAPKIRKLSEKGHVRQGFFERADFEAAAKALPDYLQGFARFGHLSGWRKGEIASLRWQDVDRTERTARLQPEHSKNGEGRLLTLEGELWEVIERQWEARQYSRPDGASGVSALVFHRQGQRVKEFRKSWASACKAANVPGMLFHDLRRTAVRNMVRAGNPEGMVMKVVGHKTRSMLDRYNIVSEADIRETVKRTQAYLDASSSEQKVVSMSARK